MLPITNLGYELLFKGKLANVIELLSNKEEMFLTEVNYVPS